MYWYRERNGTPFILVLPGDFIVLKLVRIVLVLPGDWYGRFVVLTSDDTAHVLVQGTQ
jgi:hypothetical protein